MGKYFVRFEEPDCEIIPIGCVLTMVGTGSEMNAGSVITNQNTKEKSVMSLQMKNYAEIYNPQSSLYNDIAEIPNGVGNL